MKVNHKLLKSIIVGTLMFTMIGCASAQETSTTIEDSTVKEEVAKLSFEDVYEALQATNPSLSIVKNVKTDSYNWFKQRNEVTLDGTKFYIDEYQNYDDAKMYTEVVDDFNKLDQYATNTLGVTSEYLTQEKINLDSYKIKDNQFDKFVFVYANSISDKFQKQIKTSLKTLEENKESQYSTSEYSKYYKHRKEKWDTDAYQSLNEVFEEKDKENQTYVDDTIAKYQDTNVSEDNYLTLNKDIATELSTIKVVSSTTRYAEMYQPLQNQLNEIQTQCSDIITNHSNDLDSKITSLEKEMNYDLLVEVGTLYTTYKTEDAYADKVDGWNTRITSLNKAAEQKKAEEEAAEKAEEERLAAEAAKKAEEEKQAQLAAEVAKKAEAEKAAQQATQQASEPAKEMVWIPRTGSKYHSRSSCSNMKNPSQVTIDQAKSSGYSPCKKCYG